MDITLVVGCDGATMDSSLAAGMEACLPNAGAVTVIDVCFGSTVTVVLGGTTGVAAATAAGLADVATGAVIEATGRAATAADVVDGGVASTVMLGDERDRAVLSPDDSRANGAASSTPDWRFRAPAGRIAAKSGFTEPMGDSGTVGSTCGL